MARYRRESKLDGNQVPKPLEAKVKGLNDDWSHIASLTADMFAARVRSPRKLVEETFVEVNQHTLHAEVPIIVEDWSEGTVHCFYYCQNGLKRVLGVNSKTSRFL